MNTSPAERTAGIALVVGAALLLVLSSFRPQLPDPLPPGAAIEQLVGIAHFSRWIYGSILVSLGLSLFGFLAVGARLGWSSTRVQLGGIALVAGVAFLSGSALVRGFVLPDVARSYTGSDSDVLIRASYLVTSLSVMGDVLAKLGFGSVSAAVLAWSATLITRTSRPLMALGAAGLAVTVVPALLLYSDVLDLAGSGLIVIACGLAVWSVAAGGLLARGMADEAVAAPAPAPAAA